MNVFELSAVLTLDSSKFEQGLSTAENSVANASKDIAAKAEKMKSAMLTVTGAGVAAVAAFGVSSTKEAISFESAFTGVTKTVEETTTTSYEMLSDAIKKMSTKTASSKEIIAGVMEAAGQLGISADDIVGFTKTMVELGDTTNLSAEEAAIALARFTNITGTSSSDVDKLGAAIVDLGNNFATDEASIVSMSTRLAAAGTMAGMSSTDILALSTAMSSVGIQAEAGGTAMTQVLTNIGNAVKNGSEKVGTFAKVAGMSAEDFSTAWKTSPVEALSAFIIGLDGITESGGNVNAFLEELGIDGIRETNMVKSLALASDVLTAAVDTANTAFAENVALSNEAEKRYGTTESKIVQLQNAWSNLKVELGENLLPYANQIIEWLTNTISKADEILPKIIGVASAFGTFAVAINITSLVKKVTTAVQAFFAILAANPIALVIAAIVGLISYFVTLYNTNEEFREEVQQLWNSIKEVWSNIKEHISGVVERIKLDFELLKLAIAILTEAFHEKIEDIKQKWQEFQEHLHEKGERIKGIFTGIKDAFAEAWGGIQRFFDEDIPNAFNNAVDFLKELPQRAVKWGSDLIGNFVDGLISGVSAVWDKIVEVAEMIASPFKHSVPKVGPFKDEKKWMPHLMENLADGLKKNAHLVTDQISDSFDMTANLTSNLRGASPALSAGPTTNTWNITVNGIDELEEVVRWYQGRQIEGRMR